MSEPISKPHATYELTLRISSCDWQHITDELARLSEYVRDLSDAASYNIVSGGPSGGSYLDIKIDKAVTRESYSAALSEWVKSQRTKEVTP